MNEKVLPTSNTFLDFSFNRLLVDAAALNMEKQLRVSSEETRASGISAESSRDNSSARQSEFLKTLGVPDNNKCSKQRAINKIE